MTTGETGPGLAASQGVGVGQQGGARPGELSKECESAVNLDALHKCSRLG